MFLVTIGRCSVSVPKQTLGHDSNSDWPDLQFGVEDIKHRCHAQQMVWSCNVHMH